MEGPVAQWWCRVRTRGRQRMLLDLQRAYDDRLTIVVSVASGCTHGRGSRKRGSYSALVIREEEVLGGEGKVEVGCIERRRSVDERDVSVR